MQKKAHFIGIAGMGMSATAILLKEGGWEVTGSDSEAYPPATDQLERHGISVAPGYRPENIPDDAELIVVGKSVALKREKNPEINAAYGSGKRIAPFAEVLGSIVKDREPIVVAGSYGKSTTAALLAWILSHSGVDTGWFIGASPEGMEPAHLGTHPIFILEGDEYPTSHDDPRAKFLHYHAHDCLVTAAVHDHVNIYKTQEEFLKPFRALAARLPDDGLLACSDEPHAASLAKDTRAEVATYGSSSASDWWAKNIAHGEMTTFDLMRGSERVASLETALLGAHNVQNIVGASALLLEKKLVTTEELAAAVRDFKGLTRRLDQKTSSSSVPAYEGFGSSREKLRAAIQALKDRYPEKRLVVVFEPHSFSWHNKKMLHWFDDAFLSADTVVLYKPPSRGALPEEQSSQKEMIERLHASGVATKSAESTKDTLALLESEIHDGDVVLLSSSGPMDGLIDEIPKWLDNHF